MAATSGAHVLTAVTGAGADHVAIKTALLSVSDKTGLVELGKALAARGVTLLSTGGTAKSLRDAGLTVKDVSDHTGFPEIMDGRVKTLHPKIHGGLLGVRGAAKHKADMAEHGIVPIDLVVVNLYAFRATVAKGGDFATCIENIDIGGPSMLRSAAKNNDAVAVLSSPAQYPRLLAELEANNGATSRALRRSLAAAAFALTAAYDAAIAEWFAGQVAEPTATATTAAAGGAGASSASALAASDLTVATTTSNTAATLPAPSSSSLIVRAYTRDLTLKYGCNPHQAPSFIGRLASHPSLPFKVLNGTPGYINLLDAANAWQLALELRTSTGLAAAASFKHVSPAGAAVSVPIDADTAAVYDLDPAVAATLTPVATAYMRARNADPLCSFGDFAAVSDVVDEATAAFLKTEVSDGIIAPGFTPAALEILKTKKSGGFVILEADPAYVCPEMEYREVYGVMFGQRRNDAKVTPATITSTITTSNKALPEGAVRDLVVASIAIKYTQSNSVGYAMNGQMVGVGAGQQSRVDCVKLAGRKVSTWWLRHHPKVRALPFKAGTKKQDRVNARVRYIEGDFTPVEYAEWKQAFETEPEPLTDADRSSWLATLSGVSISSDAFFPFRDSIDVAARYGVKYLAHPGGSVRDADVNKAADEYGMTMAHTGLRLFHH